MTTDRDFKFACDKALTDGINRLGLEFGIVSRIEDELYEVFCVVSQTNVFQKGEKFPLQLTYCREVFSKNKTIALTEIEGIPGLAMHPLYMPMALEAYIGSPIINGSRVWGTINFTSMRVRAQAFSEEEKRFVEDAAYQLGKLIEVGH